RQLEENGAEAIAICANTPHMVYPFVQPKINIPILHIADATGHVAREQGLTKLGLFGNKPTMTGDFISARLKDHFNIDVILPGEYVPGKHDPCIGNRSSGSQTVAQRVLSWAVQNFPCCWNKILSPCHCYPLHICMRG